MYHYGTRRLGLAWATSELAGYIGAGWKKRCSGASRECLQSDWPRHQQQPSAEAGRSSGHLEFTTANRLASSVYWLWPCPTVTASRAPGVDGARAPEVSPTWKGPTRWRPHDALRTPELPAGEDAFDEHAAVPIVRCSSVCVTRRLPWSEEGQDGEAAALASGRMVHIRPASIHH
jgi:hypothetical protein